MADEHFAWEPAAYADRLVDEAARLAAVAQAADLTTAVPTCPGWTLAKLLKHVGTAHAWGVANAGAAAPARPVDPRTLDLGLPSDPADLPVWLVEGAERAAEFFRTADPDAPAWTFGPVGHARFWSRRAYHETLVHRVDTELAAGVAPFVDPAGAADGVDELLTILTGALGGRPRPTGAGETLHIHLTGDTGGLPGEWTITLTPDGHLWERGHAKGDAAIRGDAADVLLVLYARRDLDAVEVLGQGAVVRRWLETATL